MSEQTDQIKTDVEALQTATAAAADHIAALTNYTLALGEDTVTDEQFANLHQALVDVTDTLRLLEIGTRLEREILTTSVEALQGAAPAPAGDDPWDAINHAVTKSQDALGPIATPNE